MLPVNCCDVRIPGRTWAEKLRVAMRVGVRIYRFMQFLSLIALTILCVYDGIRVAPFIYGSCVVFGSGQCGWFLASITRRAEPGEPGPRFLLTMWVDFLSIVAGIIVISFVGQVTSAATILALIMGLLGFAGNISCMYL